MHSTPPYVVIPAGGVGTRLWPLSRAARPKFLHALSDGHRSLLQETYDRLIPLSEPSRVFVVTGAAHSDAVSEQLPELDAEQIIAEPFGRDSCAAIGLAAAIISRRDPEAVMASFAADHLIGDLARFRESVETAVRGAQGGYLMTIGMTPTRVETGYGYVRCGAVTDVPGVRQVLRFEEKPQYDVAAEYVRSGEFLWNASVFIWRTDVFLDSLARYSPDIHEKLTRIAVAWDTPGRHAVLNEVWPTVPRIAIEYAVMEPAAADGKVATVPGDFGWHDVGDFHTLGEILDNGTGSPIVVPAENPGEVIAHDTKGLVVLPGGGRLVAAVGVENLVIVDTGDAVLVCSRDRAQDVKTLTEQLRDAGLSNYL